MTHNSADKNRLMKIKVRGGVSVALISMCPGFCCSGCSTCQMLRSLI